MLRWNDGESVENAQWLVLNSIFGVVQYSAVLEKASPEMRAMLKRWIDFARRHSDALLRGRITPHRPDLNYPVVESESESERIVVVYDPTVAFDPGSVGKTTFIIDATTGAITRLLPGVENNPTTKEYEK
jgi:alpha-galactosidase